MLHVKVLEGGRGQAGTGTAAGTAAGAGPGVVGAGVSNVFKMYFA